jgi:hypothetical protein
MPMKIQTSAIAALLASIAAPALAEMKYDNGAGGTALLYGQFDPAYLSFDDGVSTISKIVDNVNSNSRVGFYLIQPYGENTFRFNFETALGFRPSSGVNQTSTPSALDWDRTSIRKVDFSLATASWGTFYAGQGSMATDGVAEQDLSGTTLVTYASISDTAGGFEFRTAAGALSGVTIGSTYSDFDGGRRGRVRYDTPTIAGFTMSAAWGQEILSETNDDEYLDVALRYANEFGNLRVNGAVGFSQRDSSGVKTDDTIGSVSLLHASGFNFTSAAGKRDGDGKYWYNKIGYIGDWLSVGTTAISVDYYDGKDFNTDGSSSTSFGVGAVQKFDNANVEAYLGYRKYELSQIGMDYRDASSILAGARWKF